MKKIHVSILLLALALSGGAKAQQEQSLLIGQHSDGNRSSPIHVIDLFDDQGKPIHADDTSPKPFSQKQTCGQCHDYGQIASGWHFNGHDASVDAGRPGQPWVLVDVTTRTQIPVTARQWEGTFSPEQLGITPWEFVKMNFGHFPGGSYGEMESEDPEEAIRQEISGKFEINCLACHSADSRYDQNEAALQAARQNYRWIAASSTGMAEVSGVASSLDNFFDPEFDEGITLKYKDELFNDVDMVFFDIARSPLNKRCYFCHSNQHMTVPQEDEWTEDEDVHLTSGLDCADCHRNGNDHMTIRGNKCQGPGKALTCEGCHVGDQHSELPELGRLGAPKPAHRGIPTIHFEALTCTACHSGPWPDDQADRWRTARIHQTGLHGGHDLNLQQPHVYAPVMMKGADGKIGPYKVMWPAYWAAIVDDKPVPIAPKVIPDEAKGILKESVDKVDDWKPLTEEQIAEVLTMLGSEETKAVYIAGGKMYQFAGQGQLDISKPEFAEPYAWPMAHDVRPAEQALGVRKCNDCHTTDSSFFFGKVELDTPVQSASGMEFVEMIELQGIDQMYMWTFNALFVFRPMMKIIAFASCGVIGMVLLAYLLKAIVVIAQSCTREEVS